MRHSQNKKHPWKKKKKEFYQSDATIWVMMNDIFGLSKFKMLIDEGICKKKRKERPSPFIRLKRNVILKLDDEKDVDIE